MAGKLEKVYADALFELAQEENALDGIYEEICEISNIFSMNEDFVKLFAVPTIPNTDKKNIISSCFEGKVCATVFNFLNVLCDKNRMKYFSSIAEEFKRLYNDANNILEVTAVTTQKLSDALRQKLVEKLEKNSGKKIILVEKIDKDIMGGIVLKYNNTQIDASVKSRLDNMRQQIDSIIA